MNARQLGQHVGRVTAKEKAAALKPLLKNAAGLASVAPVARAAEEVVPSAAKAIGRVLPRAAGAAGRGGVYVGTGERLFSGAARSIGTGARFAGTGERILGEAAQASRTAPKVLGGVERSVAPAAKAVSTGANAATASEGVAGGFRPQGFRINTPANPYAPVGEIPGAFAGAPQGIRQAPGVFSAGSAAAPAAAEAATAAPNFWQRTFAPAQKAWAATSPARKFLGAGVTTLGGAGLGAVTADDLPYAQSLPSWLRYGVGALSGAAVGNPFLRRQLMKSWLGQRFVGAASGAAGGNLAGIVAGYPLGWAGVSPETRDRVTRGLTALGAGAGLFGPGVAQRLGDAAGHLFPFTVAPTAFLKGQQMVVDQLGQMTGYADPNTGTVNPQQRQQMMNDLRQAAPALAPFAKALKASGGDPAKAIGKLATEDPALMQQIVQSVPADKAAQAFTAMDPAKQATLVQEWLRAQGVQMSPQQVQGVVGALKQMTASGQLDTVLKAVNSGQGLGGLGAMGGLSAMLGPVAGVWQQLMGMLNLGNAPLGSQLGIVLGGLMLMGGLLFGSGTVSGLGGIGLLVGLLPILLKKLNGGVA